MGEFGTESGLEFGEGVLLAGEDDEVLGGQIVLGSVGGGGGFPLRSARAGRMLGVGAVGGDLLFGSHGLGRPFWGEVWK